MAKSVNKRYAMIGLLFLMPAVIVYLIFAVVPFFDNLVLSFQEWNGFSARTFVGVDNYVEALTDDVFQTAIKNSVFLGVFSSIVSVIIGVLFAWLLLFVSRGWGGMYRTILFSPSMIPAVITALIFSFVFEPEFGILNSVFRAIGLESMEHAWLTDQHTVMGCLLFVSAWKQVGLTMVLCFAGMQSIPFSLFEAAKLEGAGDWYIFRKIIAPLTGSFIQLSAVFALMSGLKIYDTVFALTNGGPGNYTMVMPMWIMRNTFSFNEYGFGAAMSVIFVLIVLIGEIAVKKLVKGDSYEF